MLYRFSLFSTVAYGTHMRTHRFLNFQRMACRNVSHEKSLVISSPWKIPSDQVSNQNLEPHISISYFTDILKQPSESQKLVSYMHIPCTNMLH